MKIHYGYYKEFYREYKKNLDEIRTLVENYIIEIDDLLANGVIAGRVHDELNVYKTHVNKLPSLVDEISNKIEPFVTTYLDGMNEAQKVSGKCVLYRENYYYTRDYTDEAFEQISRRCDNFGCESKNILERINDWGEDILAGIFDFIGKEFNLFNVKQTQYLLMEKNDVTKKKLKGIKTNLNQKENYFRDQIILLEEILVEIENYVNILLEVMTSDPTNFTMERFSTRLTNVYNGMIEKLHEIDFSPNITMGEIKKFLSLDQPQYFFDDQSKVIFAYLAELASTEWCDWDFWKITITQQFDIAKQKLKYFFGSNYEYDDYIRDREMLTVIDNVVEASTFDDSLGKKALDTTKTFMEYIKKFGDEWEKHLEGVRRPDGKLILDKRTTTYKIFRETFDQFGSAKKILKYGTDLCEIVAQVSADYDNNLSVLNSFARNATADKEMLESIERIRNRYEKTLSSIGLSVYDKVSEYGIDFITSNIDKVFNVSVFSAVGVVEMGIDVVGNATGISDDGKAMMELLSYGHDQMFSSKTAYENSLKTLQNTPPESENYQQCVEDFKNCFTYYKTTMSSLYQKMAASSTGVESSYYGYCADTLSELTLKNYDYVKIMTFEEYKKL